jgi:hypothetical protein
VKQATAKKQLRVESRKRGQNVHFARRHHY